jgi:hypothetical protein
MNKAMAKSISEFIMEQDTDVISENYATDNFVSVYAECASALSVANCYAELASLGALALDNDGYTSFVMESGDDKPGVFSKLGGALKKAWEAFIKFWRTIIGKIKGFFVDKKVEAVNNKLDGMDPTTMLKLDIRVLNPYIFMIYAESVLSLLKDAGVKGTSTDLAWANKAAQLKKNIEEDISTGKPISDIQKRMGEVTAAEIRLNDSDLPEYETVGSQKIKITVGEFKKVVKFFQSDRAKKRIDDLQRKVDELEKSLKKIEEGHAETLKKYNDYKSLDSRVQRKVAENRKKNGTTGPEKPEDAYDTEEKLGNEAKYHQIQIKRLNEIIDVMSKLYEQMIGVYSNIANTVLRDPESVKAKEKEEKVSESAYLV